MTKAQALQFLPWSQNVSEKNAIEYIAAALPDAPARGLVSLRLDDCSLKPQALDALGECGPNDVSPSPLKYPQHML